MNKIESFFILILMTIFIQGNCQEAQRILGIAKENKSVDYYEEQLRLWKQETEKSPQNENAWYQRYKAHRAFLQKSKPHVWENDQEQILKELEPVIVSAYNNLGDSYVYYILESYNCKGIKSLDFIQKAYNINPTRTETFERLLVDAVSRFDENKAKEIALKILESNFYASANFMWNLNSLKSIEPNGVFISNGDLDTMPKWVLQYGQGIRPDVLVVSKWLMVTDESYRRKVLTNLNIKNFLLPEEDFDNPSLYMQALTGHLIKLSSRPIYFACGTDVKFLKANGVANNMYVTGANLKYSKTAFDNQEVTVRNFEHTIRLDYLFNNFQVHPENNMIKTQMNLTYLPGLIKVKEHFKEQKNEERAAYYSSIIDLIIAESGRKGEIRDWFE